MHIDIFLRKMVDADGSDLYLTVGAPPSMKTFGRLVAMNDHLLTSEDLDIICDSIFTPEQLSTFNHKWEVNVALSISGVGRFRVNGFVQRNHRALVIRNIKMRIPTIDELNLPPILKDLIMEKRGLVLIVGATGTGKSTTLASMIDHRNTHSAAHIITVEDPIEYIHKHGKSVVNQREIGVDTQSYEDALQNTLRQAPDVILIGEIRSRNTMQHALTFAETGHLCLSTLHANNANQTLDRIVNFFPQEVRQQVLLDLSMNLQAIISQRLVPTLDGKRVAAFEILTATPFVRELISRGEIHTLKEVMEKSENQGMFTFDSSLFQLVSEGRISPEEALKNADSKNNLRLRMTLEAGIELDSDLELSLEKQKDETKSHLHYRMQQL